MIKRLTMLRIQSGLVAEDVLAHWRTSHAELVPAVPGLRRYVQNHCVPGPAGDAGAQPPFSGLGEVWLDDFGAAEAAMSTSEWRAVLTDAATFMDMESLTAAWAEEHVFELERRSGEAG
jgi:uncharacterized protein (TIGR02118 family)